MDTEILFAARMMDIAPEDIQTAQGFFADKQDYFRALNGPSHEDILAAKKDGDKKFGPKNTYHMASFMKSSLNTGEKLAAFEKAASLFKAVEYYNSGQLYHKDKAGNTRLFTPELQNEKGEVFSKDDKDFKMYAQDISEANFLKVIRQIKLATPEYKKQVEDIERKLGYKPQRISYRDMLKHGLFIKQDDDFSKEEARKIVDTKEYESIGEFFHHEAKKYYNDSEGKKTAKVNIYDHIFKVLFSMDFLAQDLIYVEPKEAPKDKTDYSNSDQLARNFPKPSSSPVLFEPQKIYNKNMVAGFYDKPYRYTIAASLYNKTYLKEVISLAKELTPENTAELERVEQMFGLNRKIGAQK